MSCKWWKRVFSYCIECSLGNGYVLDSYVRPDEHACKGRMKRFLELKYEVDCGLIGTYRSRRRVGRPRSYEHTNAWLLPLGHWPKNLEGKGNCVVCQAILNRKNLPTLGNRHETRVQCEHCGVYLCIASTRDCFKKYHTRSDYSR